jgi:hypothetical protein
MTSDKFFVISKQAIKEFGLEASLLLAELALWQDSCNDWFYRTQDQIRDETGLSQSVQNKAVKLLKSKGILKTKLKGLPAKLYYFIQLPALAEFLKTEQASFSKIEKLDTEKTPNKILQKSESLNKKQLVRHKKKDLIIDNVSLELEAKIQKYFEYRSEIKKPFKSQKSIDTKIQQFIEQSKLYGELAVIDSIESAIANAWQGTFIDKKFINNQSKSNENGTHEKTFGFIKQVTNFEL